MGRTVPCHWPDPKKNPVRGLQQFWVDFKNRCIYKHKSCRRNTSNPKMHLRKCCSGTKFHFEILSGFGVIIYKIMNLHELVKNMIKVRNKNTVKSCQLIVCLEHLSVETCIIQKLSIDLTGFCIIRVFTVHKSFSELSWQWKHQNDVK